MLFNSYAYIFALLPVALVGYAAAARLGSTASKLWLIACSLFFYGWWNIHFLGLLLGSIAINYGAATLVMRASADRPRLQASLLGAAIAVDLGLLFFYKYLFACCAALGLLADLPAGWAEGIVLPLGISFFTFTQIGYLVDSSAGLVERHSPIDYVLFVTFFPHLIAGPILHNQEMIPQFAERRTFRLRVENISVGLSIFTLGLLKKVVVADPLGRIADPVFANPHLLGPHATWQGVLAYSLQLYFDFSGYSDMAIGSARLFGIVFPMNFNSPYKSLSIIEFWQRWHMTLTRYLTLYLYNPIALSIARYRMNKGLGVSRREMRSLGGFCEIIVVPTFITIVLAGIWHGAGRQFAIFGALHAVYLSVNHAWRVIRPRRRDVAAAAGAAALLRPLAYAGLTYSAVLVAQVFFRATSVTDALSILGGMAGSHPVHDAFRLPDYMLAHAGGAGRWLVRQGVVGVSPNATDLKAWLRIACGFVLVWRFPNTQQIMGDFSPVLGPVRPSRLMAMRWSPDLKWGLAIGVGLICCLYNLDDASRFLYFQF